MTIITASIRDSAGNPLTGYILVTLLGINTSSVSLYVPVTSKIQLTNGAATFDLEPSDLARTSYVFEVIREVTEATEDTEGNTVTTVVPISVYKFTASIPYSNVAIKFTDLAMLTGVKYDAQDSALLTLARFLYQSDIFWEFLVSRVWQHKGGYNTLTYYKRGDVVSFNGSSYQYVSESSSVGNNPLTEYWRLLASKGDPG